MAELFHPTARVYSSYTAKDIEVLEGLEPVRRRPGMYIGGTDADGLHHLVAELLDNAMDEVVSHQASRIDLGNPALFVATTQSGGPAPQIQAPLGARGAPHHASFGRQVQQQSL